MLNSQTFVHNTSLEGSIKPTEGLFLAVYLRNMESSEANIPNDTKCSLLWKHICIRPQFIQLPCCRYIPSDKNESVKSSTDIHLNSPSLVDIRKKMIANEPITGCKACYSEEGSGGRSLRLKSNQEFEFPETLKPEADLKDIEYLEFFVGSVCNLKCMYCSPHLSTSLKKDYHQLGWVYSDFAGISDFGSEDDPELYQVIGQLENLNKIKFVGGEPFLNKNHNDWIKDLTKEQAQKLELIYYTNGTQRPTQKTIEAWKNSRKVQLWLSIDALGTQNDYLRMNSNWSEIEKNVDFYYTLTSDLPHLEIYLNMTVTPFNVFSIKDVEEWFNKLQLKFFDELKTEAYLTYVIDPQEFSLDFAPASMLEELNKRDISELSRQHQKIISSANLRRAPEELRSTRQKEFLDKVSAFDRIRNSSFPLSFPNAFKHYSNT